MSASNLIIDEQSRDIGDFLVGRLLPFRRKRMVGPFIFVDHMGPSLLGPKKYLDVDRHPHIGLATLTYLLEGEILHQDSLGMKQIIRPGDVNWMVAGQGVTHTERTPGRLRNGKQHTLHGYQIWVALPVEHELAPPQFFHFDSNKLPEWQEGGAQFKLIAGTGFNQSSPVPVHSELFMIDVKTVKEHILPTGNHLKGEVGIAVVHGAIETANQIIKPGQMWVSQLDGGDSIVLQPQTHILLFGGQPFPEERFIDWNFVSSEKTILDKAKEKWKQDRFPKVPGDDTYVVMP